MKRLPILIFLLFLNYIVFCQKITDSLYYHAPFQVSIITPFGTNGLNSFKTVNKFSFNIIAGYHAGLEGFEIGTIFNGESDWVKGTQISGFANAALGELNGAQIGGIFNVAHKKSEGFQIAGVTNISSDDFKGTNIAGISNISFKSSQSVQISGITNLTIKDFEGCQISGAGNFAGNANGIQLSGLANISNRVEGAQISGGVNVANDVNGIQVSGLVNLAKKVEGAQIGLLNFCDTINGLPVGLVSFVKKGYRAIELTGGDALNFNITYKMGVNRLYNLYSFGANFYNSFSWAFGLGYGSRFFINDRNVFAVEFIRYQLKSELINFTENALTQIKFNFATQANDKLILKIGPVCNIFASTIKLNYNNEFKIAPYYFYNHTNKKQTKNTKMWIGLQVGIEF
jgi:hypothetical protein